MNTNNRLFCCVSFRNFEANILIKGLRISYNFVDLLMFNKLVKHP